jgi:TetR/AcrR family transcriptional repressor of nem operon
MTRAQPYNRDAAIDAAMTLFWQKGYHATSLKDLEGALSMKPGSIYAAFSSKEKLFNLSLERYFTSNRDEFRKFMAAADTPLTGLANFLRKIGAPNHDDPTRRACMLVKSLLNTTSEDGAITRQISDYLSMMEAEMAAVFEQAKHIGELCADADTATLARRFQSDVTALKIEAQRQVDPAILAASAEQRARQIIALRQS